MRRYILFSLVLLMTLAGCKKEKPVTPQQQIAGQAAVQYYSYLQRGDFTAFVDGIYYANPIPKDYRAVLERNARQFAHEQDSIRGGIRKVKVSRADLMRNDSTAAAVYLLISFGDSTSEEVLVPMVKRKDVWYMK